jgi:hypothetical protein
LVVLKGTFLLANRKVSKSFEYKIKSGKRKYMHC